MDKNSFLPRISRAARGAGDKGRQYPATRSSVGTVALTALFIALCACLPPLRASGEARAFGYTEPFKLIKVSSPESGVLVEMRVQEGDHVGKGQIVAKLDCRVLESERAIAKEELSRIALRHDKLARLVKSRNAAVEEVERVTSEMTIQELRLKRIDTQIENFTLRAPVDGIVSDVKVEVSESVGAASTHLYTVVQVDKLLLNLYLPVEQARKFNVGDEAPLYFFDSQTRAAGTVAFVSPVGDPVTGTVRVKLVIENPNGELRSGVRCGLQPLDNTPAKKP